MNRGAGDNLAKSWESVRAEAMGCTRCDLYKTGTQTVFGCISALTAAVSGLHSGGA